MADAKISALTSYSNPDPVNDVIAIVDNTNTTTKKISRNNLLGITSTPVGINDSQTLTSKTLTAPTINGATLSGTLSGTYTIGGTPTFPASVVTLTGSQTLTNKILTSPTINGPTITNASITQDAVTGFSSANTGTLYGISVTSSVITSAAVGSSSFVTGVKVVDKMQNPYKFSVYASVGQSIAIGATTKIQFNTKEFDTGANFDNVTNFRFTAPVTGFYFIHATVAIAPGGMNSTGQGIGILYKNGVEFKRGGVIKGTGDTLSDLASQITTIASLVAGDYIELFGYNGDPSSARTTGGGANITYMSGFLVSAT